MVEIVSFNPSLSVLYLAAAPDEDLTGFSILTYRHSGNSAVFDAAFPLNTSSPYYEPGNPSIVYYEMSVPISQNRIRTALAISDQNDNVVDLVGWGNDSNFNLNGGDAGGTTISTANGNYGGDNDLDWYSRVPGASWDGNNGSPDNGLPPNVTPGFPPCFTRGTLISTPAGDRPVETLRVGDRIVTIDGREREILWIASRRVSFPNSLSFPHLRPVVIDVDALGPGRPYRQLRVSPQHRIVVESPLAELYFGEPTALVAALHLVHDSKIERDDSCDHVEYFHFLLETHDVVISNGLASESLCPGPFIHTSMAPAQRAELLELFPELVQSFQTHGRTCLPVLKRWEASALQGWPDRKPNPREIVADDNRDHARTTLRCSPRPAIPRLTVSPPFR